MKGWGWERGGGNLHSIFMSPGVKESMQKVFTGVNVNPFFIAQGLQNWLMGKGYTTQMAGAGNSYLVQAKKTGVLRAIFGADRAFTIRIMGGNGTLTVDVGLAGWLKALDVGEDAVAALEIPPLALVEGAEELWDMKIERDIIKEVERLIPMSPPPQTFTQNPWSQGQPQGYPGNYQYGNYGGYGNYPAPGYGLPQGYPTQGAKFCPSCGSQLVPNARFCPSCGSRIF